jgi:branched-chain amino acid transport system permease protein
VSAPKLPADTAFASARGPLTWLERVPRWVKAAGVALAIVTAPFVIGTLLGNYWVRVMDMAALYAILALGLNVVVGMAGLLDLGYVAFYAVGAYTMGLLASPQLHLQYNFWLLLPLAGVLAAIAGVALGYPVLRLRSDYLAMVTLAFGEIVRIFLNNLDSPVNITNGPMGISGIAAPSVLGYSLKRNYDLFGVEITYTAIFWYLILLLGLATGWLLNRLRDSRIGWAWGAIREDELAAKTTGIDVRQLKLYAFGTGAFFAGFAGCIFAAFQGFVSPDSFTLFESIAVLCMVVLGGIGSLPGVVVGAVVLTVLPESLRGLNTLQQSLLGHQYVNGTDLRMVIYSVVLLLVIVFRPQGLWGSEQRRRELTAGRAGA